MHSAPSVSYPVGRSRFAAALLLLGWVLGAGATASWWVQAPSAGWRLGVACFMLAASGACAAWGWWHSPSGILAWDGETWNWTNRQPAQSGAVAVTLDLQHCLLLRWTAENASHWLWLERSFSSERWDDLRRAVYSRARLEALPHARPPAAKP